MQVHHRHQGDVDRTQRRRLRRAPRAGRRHAPASRPTRCSSPSAGRATPTPWTRRRSASRSSAAISRSDDRLVSNIAAHLRRRRRQRDQHAGAERPAAGPGRRRERRDGHPPPEQPRDRADRQSSPTRSTAASGSPRRRPGPVTTARWPSSRYDDLLRPVVDARSGRVLQADRRVPTGTTSSAPTCSASTRPS